MHALAARLVCLDFVCIHMPPKLYSTARFWPLQSVYAWTSFIGNWPTQRPPDSMGTWSTPILPGSRLGVDTRRRSPPPISTLDSIYLAFMLVRLSVLTVAAFFTFNMMHSYLDGCVLGNGKHAPAFGLDPVAQSLLRLTCVYESLFVPVVVG